MEHAAGPTHPPAAASAAADDPLTSSPPVVMAPRTDGVEVAWALTAPARGWVEWRTVDEHGDASDHRISACDAHGFVPQGTELLRVRVEGMTPGREHLLRTVTVSTTDDRREVSEWKRVRTLDPEAEASSFVVWNDTHQQPETLALLDDRSPRADVWVWNGDVCNNWNDPAEIVPTILSPAGRDVTDGRPLAFSWGNHDVRGPWAYRLPEVVATPSGLPYYAWRSGPLAAIVLSTGEDKPDHHPSFEGRVAFAELRRRQVDWLTTQIRRPGFVDAPYRVVFCHMPLRWLEEPHLTEQDYADGAWDHVSLTSRELWHDALVEWGAQVIISGHTHRAARIEATAELPYIQLTGGGKTPDTATWIEGAADARSLTVTAHHLDGSVAHRTSVAPYGGA